MPAARLNHEYWISLCGHLAVYLAEDKHQLPWQTMEYGGFLLDTHAGRLAVADGKLPKLLAGVREWRSETVTTIRRLAEQRGRLIHYSQGISYVRILATELSWHIGTEEEPDYDREVQMDAALSALAEGIENLVSVFGPLGRPLWPPVASSLVAAFESGEAKRHLAVLSTDSSPAGWAALLRWWGVENIREQLFIGTWPAGATVQEQVHREALGVELGLSAALSSHDLRGWAIIQQNDAQPVVTALRKGSGHSRVLQDMALRVNELCAASRVELIPRHVPGSKLVEDGIDGASRDGAHFGTGANAYSLQGPAVSDGLWELVRDTAARAGHHMTVDRFASAVNRRLPRFNSRYPEPDAEATDALAQLDWNSSSCPTCGRVHREVNYICAPRPLERAALRKAIADGVLAVIVTPLAVTNPFWHKLVRASVLATVDGYVRVKGARARMEHSQESGSRELAIFVCDFAPYSARQTQTTSAPCAGFFTRRPKKFEGAAPEDATLLRLRRELQHLAGWRQP